MNTDGLIIDYQPDAVQGLLDALKQNGAAVDGSDMGVGKTAHAVAVIRELKLPTLALVPAVAISGWKWMGDHLKTEFEIESHEMVRLGRSPYGWWDNPPPKRLPTFFKCTQCQCVVDPAKPFPCPHHHTGIHCVKTYKKEHNYGKFNWHPAVKLLVIDEIHRFGGLDSLNADMLISAKTRGLPVLGLSATLGDSPLGFRGIGFCLGLHSLVDTNSTPGFYRWAAKHGVRRVPMMGLQWMVGEDKKLGIMNKLHDEIFPSRGVRVRIKDLGDKFPDCKITAELIDLDKGGQIEKLYKQMERPLEAMHDRRNSDVSGPLSDFLRLHQEIGLLKCPVMAEIAQEGVKAGHHVALFVNYRAELEALCELLDTQCRIDGSQTGPGGQARRQRNIEDFCEDREEYIIATIPAGGIAISLKDCYGNFPRLGLSFLNPSARMMRQVFGRLPRQGGKSKSLYRVLCAAGTREVKNHRALTMKLNNLDALNDGDCCPENLPLTSFEECGKLF